jgi:hypothetical protein
MAYDNAQGVKPRGGPQTYMDNALGEPIDMIDMDGVMVPANLEAAFKANACMMDGCSGKLEIDTLYNNTVNSGTDVINPRSQEQGPPDMVPGPDVKRPLYPQRRR